ncbi:hypothetical protein DFH06DRAFT_549716 [Mycena polygramma]|nr:hypothetical protein DFH06DRAFT_549716 [Mycena polygramma]
MEAAPPKRKITVVKVTEASPQRNYVSRSPSPYKSYAAAAPSPTFKPKAKVNSSATPNLPGRKATSVVSSLSRTASVKSSPSKQRGSPVPRARAPITRGVTSAPRVGTQEPRRGSLSGATSLSYASSSAPVTVSEILNLSDDESSPAPSPRITARLSRQSSHESPPSPSLLPNSSLRAQSHRPRVPSISSNASSSSSPYYNNSTTTTSSAPNRFQSVRASPPSSAGNYYQPFPRDDASPRYPRVNGFSKVDPATRSRSRRTPRPTSAVSFSSRSSRSPSSVSLCDRVGHEPAERAAPRGRRLEQHALRAREPHALQRPCSPRQRTAARTTTTTSRTRTRKGGRCRARSSCARARRSARCAPRQSPVRKIADLEITNRSLLTINSSLEKAKHRQAKEIRELRRKLRESRLILPPRAFRAVKSSLEVDDTAEDDDDDDDEDEEGEGGEKDDGKAEVHDVTYRRIKVILEGLLESGRRALETTPQDFPEPIKVTKVLSAYEVEAPDDDEAPRAQRAPASPSHVAVPDSDDGNLSSEDEVEAMTLPRDSPPPSHPPSPRAPASDREPA